MWSRSFAFLRGLLARRYAEWHRQGSEYFQHWAAVRSGEQPASRPRQSP